MLIAINDVFQAEIEWRHIIHLNYQPAHKIGISSRIVFKAGDYVIKMGCDEQNRDEFRLWQRIKDSEDRKSFAESLGFVRYDRYDSLLIQRYINGKLSEERRDILTAVKIAEKYKVYDMGPGRNFKVTSNGVVIFDYGTVEQQ